jgi:Ca-activated chloride channel family protein
MQIRCLIAAVLAPALIAAGGPVTFRAGSSLVLVEVSVLDSHDRPATRLTRDQFRVWDDGREQPIRFFVHDDAPVSIAIILDSSGSMETGWDRARTMLARFCESLEPRDEIFVVTVQQRPRLLLDYTRDCGDAQNHWISARPHGLTALLDAIPLAVRHLRRASNPRRAILVISDGGENASRTGVADLRRLAREAMAQVYCAVLERPGFDAAPFPEEAGPGLLAEIAALTGGRSIAIDDSRQIADAAGAIAREIHDQYLIGYQSPHPELDGRQHRISVKLRTRPVPRLSLFYRAAYRTPLE